MSSEEVSSSTVSVSLDSAPEQQTGGDSLTSPQADDSLESAEPVEGGVGVCQFFLKGKCRFGHRCRLSHSDPTLDDAAGVVLLNQEEAIIKNDENEGKHKKKKTKDNSAAAKPKDSEENGSGGGSNKKPRMRTAGEVIHRILWDPASAQGSEFVVGYVDRFLGVLERPFCEFNWDASPCDWGDNLGAELALPQHRIQYFIYRGRRVWDRNSRTDRVFGSTGQPLAPPFGGEEEVEAPAEQRDREQCACDGTTQPEEGQQNIHSPDSTRPTPHDTESHQEAEREPLPVEEEETAKEGLETLADRMSLSQRERETGESNGVEEGLEECNEICEDKTEEEQSPNGKCHSDHHQKGQQAQGGRGRGGNRPTKRKPTHFIGFRADTPSVLSAFQKLREELTSLLPASAPLWRPASKLHVTLCLLSLPGPAEVAAAADLLRRFAQLDRNPPVAVTFPVKPKHFYGKVLYLQPQPQNQLQQLNAGLQEAFREEGWLHRDSFNPRYHLTLAKGAAERLFEGVGDLKVGKGLNLGRLPVNTLHLCATGGTGADGFYHTLCSVSLR